MVMPSSGRKPGKSRAARRTTGGEEVDLSNVLKGSPVRTELTPSADRSIAGGVQGDSVESRLGRLEGLLEECLSQGVLNRGPARKSASERGARERSRKGGKGDVDLMKVLQERLGSASDGDEESDSDKGSASAGSASTEQHKARRRQNRQAREIEDVMATTEMELTDPMPLIRDATSRVQRPKD